MANRKLFKRVKVNSKNDVANYDFDLEYYILEKEIRLDGLCVNTYGIEICKYTTDSDGIKHQEYRRVYDVFCTQKETEEMIEKLAKNTVTPISLLEVLENLIGTGDLVNEESSYMAV